MTARMKAAEAPGMTPCPTIRTIMHVVADEFGTTILDLELHRRMRCIARPRQVVMYIARHMTRHSLPAIGGQLGGRDHTTVLLGVRRIEGLMNLDPDFRTRVGALIDALAIVHAGDGPAVSEALAAGADCMGSA